MPSYVLAFRHPIMTMKKLITFEVIGIFNSTANQIPHIYIANVENVKSYEILRSPVVQ